ncbi:hypothetical protein KAFR_0A08130 [Kazachstania africana CBS 2517]|uniref:Uncharacterized protein n=1 Tax=Kazachstania africana (strain ATCC 22294 / BCRC 22015 / CBS 2517 / CECT 1963 / NBRC 1671 / NRRL Y-8276) TaxID=1071382 RepID=H2APE7_KAZAF|nr:hypothetical protein KAFR_0A08130 [Kazachstania africana CBS 2517]CCF56247.1 hypothetical protein KAFR_0A08130 [Kazachstania africana CBS 2517]
MPVHSLTRTRKRSKSFRSAKSTITRTRSDSSIKIEKRILYHFHELPTWQQDNDKILGGYVRETNSFTKCIESLFYLNNESINIYSHLIPSLIYLTIAVMLLIEIDQFLNIPIYPTTTKYDFIFINIFLVGAFLCLLGSGCFHLLKQHSELQCNFWSRIDYMGIIVLISCSMMPVLYYGFFDHIVLFYCFITLTLAFASVCSIIVMSETFNLSKYRLLRACVFAAFGFSGLIPMIVGFSKFGLSGVFQRISLKFIFWESVFYLVGATLYGFRIPESILPGKFDLFGSSHQLFHCFVVIGSVLHFKAVIESYILMHSRYTA